MKDEKKDEQWRDSLGRHSAPKGQRRCQVCGRVRA